MRRIGIGGALAKRLVELGNVVQVANSKGQPSLREFAKSTGAEPFDITDVAKGVDVLMIAIPLGRVRDLPKSIFNSLAGNAIIVDTGNYYPLRDGVIAVIDRGLPEGMGFSATRRPGDQSVQQYYRVQAGQLRQARRESASNSFAGGRR